MPEKPTATKLVTNLPPNPYKGLGEGSTSRLNADISTDDFMWLKSISPRHGTLQTIVNLYVRTIIIELKAAGVNHLSDANLAKLRDIVIRHTHPSLIGEISQGHDSGGTSGVHESHKDVADQPTNNASVASARKVRGKKSA